MRHTRLRNEGLARAGFCSNAAFLCTLETKIAGCSPLSLHASLQQYLKMASLYRTFFFQDSVEISDPDQVIRAIWNISNRHLIVWASQGLSGKESTCQQETWV